MLHAKGDMVLLQEGSTWLKKVMLSYVAWASESDDDMLPIVFQGTTTASATDYSIKYARQTSNRAVPIIPPLAADFKDVLWRLWLRISDKCDIS